MQAAQAALAVLVLFASALTGTSRSNADPRLRAFLERFDIYRYDHSKYNHPNSMFYPYRSLGFENGLITKDRVIFERTSTGIDCKLATRLLTQGFLSLYPFLKEPFDDPFRFRMLMSRLRSARLPELERCQALAALLQVTRTNPDVVDAPVKMLEEILGREVFSIHPLRQEPRKRFVRAWYALGKLAFCEDYLPAIRDLLSRSHRSGGIALTHFDIGYLLGRAANHHVPSSIYRAALENLNLSEDGYDFVVEKVKQARLDRVEEFYYTGGFWQGKCTIR